MKSNSKHSIITVIAASFVCFSIQAEANFVLVSDIDDTIKMTNVGDKAEALWNLTHGHTTFLGMSELYQELAKNAAEVAYVSGGPKQYTTRIQYQIETQNRFPSGPFILRDFWVWHDVINIAIFKTEQMNQLVQSEIQGRSDLPFLMVGDDTEKDPEVYTEFLAQHPNRSLSIYIHQVSGRELPYSVDPTTHEKSLQVIPFSTAFDIALNEVNEGRLTPEQAVRVGKVILDQNDLSRIFPKFVKVCPQTIHFYDHSTAAKQSSDLISMSNQMSAYIRQFCVGRNY